MQQPTGFALWFTGLPCSGKSTLAERITGYLRERGRKVELLDGDLVRTNLCRELGFSKEDRDTNIRRIGFVAHLLSRNDVIAVVAAISPYREARSANRQLIRRFVEVYVRCPLAVCQERDRKGMYKLAMEGKISQFTGVSDPYEEPEHPDILVDSDQLTEEDSVRLILRRLVELRYLPEAVIEPARREIHRRVTKRVDRVSGVARSSSC